MLLRFRRYESHTVETLDITPDPIDGQSLDHPGGFDVDSEGRFWIPLSTSDARGPSLVCRVTIAPDQPLAMCRSETVFRVDDHIGAMCCLGDLIVGANWDTRHVYIWNTDGTEQRRIERRQLFDGGSEWALAVQDWKHFDRDGHSWTIAGGLDKSGSAPQATIQWIDLVKRDVMQTFRFGEMLGVTRPITNEGLAVRGDTLFLLPEDIGRDAKVLRLAITEVP